MSEQIDSVPSAPVSSATSDERLLAALAHGSVLLSFFGPIVPALVWSFQRRKSPYVAFHALQALGYQLLTFWVGMTAYLLFAILMGFVFLPLIVALSSNSPDSSIFAPFMLQGSIFLFLFGFMGIYVFFGVLGAALCLMGRDYKYPWLGKYLEKYLGRGADAAGSLDEIKQEQWVAGMGHASAILFLWGAILPLLTWVLQKDSSSPRLRFQSLQALAYQLMSIVAYFGFMAINMLVFMGIFGGMFFLAGAGSEPQLSSAGGILILVSMILMLLLSLIMMLALPTYHLFAMIAGIQVVKGKDYRYPLLGKFLARRFGDESSGG